MKYTSRITQITILPVGEELFSEKAIVVSIEDELGGEFITVKQPMGSRSEKDQIVAFDPEEWKEVARIIDQMFKEIKDYEEKKQ